MNLDTDSSSKISARRKKFSNGGMAGTLRIPKDKIVMRPKEPESEEKKPEAPSIPVSIHEPVNTAKQYLDVLLSFPD